MNYFADPHDLRVMIAVLRRALEVVEHWPSHRNIGPLMVPPFCAQKHGYREGATPSDALLEDLAPHFSKPCTTSRAPAASAALSIRASV